MLIYLKMESKVLGLGHDRVNQSDGLQMENDAMGKSCGSCAVCVSQIKKLLQWQWAISIALSLCSNCSPPEALNTSPHN